jgi:phage replication O-like protein O
MTGSKSVRMVYEDSTEIESYTTVPNDVLEKIADTELTHDEMKILFRVLRDTVGWEVEESKGFGKASVRRLSHDIPTERFVDKTGLPEDRVITARDSLETRHIIKRDGDEVTFNNNLDEWEDVAQGRLL